MPHTRPKATMPRYRTAGRTHAQPEPFVAQLADLCRAEPTRAKWVFVPSHAIGPTLGDRLAREGTSWANLRFVTPLDIAVRMAAPFLLERGRQSRPKNRWARRSSCACCSNCPGEPGYFRPMAEHPSMAEALWRTVRELRYAGLRHERPAAIRLRLRRQTRRTRRRSSRPTNGISRERHVADMPMVLSEAVHISTGVRSASDDIVTGDPGRCGRRSCGEFLDGLPGRKRARRACSRFPARSLPTRARTAAARRRTCGRRCRRPTPRACDSCSRPPPRRRRAATGRSTSSMPAGATPKSPRCFAAWSESASRSTTSKSSCASEDYAPSSCGNAPAARLAGQRVGGNPGDANASRAAVVAVLRMARRRLRLGRPAPPAAVGRLRAGRVRRGRRATARRRRG